MRSHVEKREGGNGSVPASAASAAAAWISPWIRDSVPIGGKEIAHDDWRWLAGQTRRRKKRGIDRCNCPMFAPTTAKGGRRGGTALSHTCTGSTRHRARGGWPSWWKGRTGWTCRSKKKDAIHEEEHIPGSRSPSLKSRSVSRPLPTRNVARALHEWSGGDPAANFGYLFFFLKETESQRRL